jgi:putative ABC transport system permease protein
MRHATTLRLAFRLARRDLRGGARAFRTFVACLALGVAAIAGVGTFSAAVVAGLEAESRRLLGGDVDMSLNHRPAGAGELAHLRRHAERLSATVEMRAMAAPAGAPARPPAAEASRARALVEVKAVDAPYPLVGRVELDPAMPLAQALSVRDAGGRPLAGAVADAGLFHRLDLAVGDRILLGDAELELRARIVREPDRVASVVSFGPRLMIGEDALAATGLVRLGSLAHYHYRVALPAGADARAWTAALKRALPGAGWRVRGTDEAAPGVRRFVERMTLFMTLVGLAVLLVGAIGVGQAVSSHLDEKTAAIATLKCLGAPSGLVFAVYLVETLAMAAAGLAVGLALGGGLPLLGLKAAAGALPVAPVLALYPAPLAWAAAFGLVGAVTAALAPLGQARDTPAGILFRSLTLPTRAPPARPYLLAAAGGVLLLAAMTATQASDRAFALWFVGGSAAALLLLRGGASLLMAAARRRPAGRPLFRLGLANLARPGSRTPSAVLSLGAGVSVLVTVALIEGNLALELGERLPEEAPAFFFIDIQPEQAAAFDDALGRAPGVRGLERLPSLRGRIVRIAGAPVEERRIAPESQWAVRGDRTLTQLAAPRPGTRIVAGAWWPADYRGPPLISLDAALAKGFGVGVGDTLAVSVLGREIEARVANLRDIDWRSLRFDFAVVFSAGTLDGAPLTHIAAVRADAGAEDAIERAVGERFANVTAIRVRDALEAAQRILDGAGSAIKGAAAVALAAGGLVLGGAIAATHRRRTYEAVVLKVLGATRRRLLAAHAVEYGLLGLAAGAFGTGLGALASWAIVVHLMGGRWTFLALTAGATWAAAALLALVFGFAGTWRALGERAATHLRNE